LYASLNDLGPLYEMRWVGYVARLVEARNKCGILDGIINVKRHLENLDVEDDVLADFKEIRC
jgi:hypothetical protein